MEVIEVGPPESEFESEDEDGWGPVVWNDM